MPLGCSKIRANLSRALRRSFEARQNLAEHYQHKGLREELFWLASILMDTKSTGCRWQSFFVLAAKALLQLSIEKKKSMSRSN